MSQNIWEYMTHYPPISKHGEIHPPSLYYYVTLAILSRYKIVPD